MNKEPYSQFESEQLILRDFLAIDRTVLANERTFLGYIRTALALFVSGVTFIKFFYGQLMVEVGWSFILFGVFTVFVGILKYRKRQRIFRHISEKTYQIRYEDALEKTDDRSMGD